MLGREKTDCRAVAVQDDESKVSASFSLLFMMDWEANK